MKKFLLYATRWQLSTPVIALCVWLLPFNPLTQTIIANFIGSVIFFKVDKLIFGHKKAIKEDVETVEAEIVEAESPYIQSLRGRRANGQFYDESSYNEELFKKEYDTVWITNEAIKDRLVDVISKEHKNE